MLGIRVQDGNAAGSRSGSSRERQVRAQSSRALPATLPKCRFSNCPSVALLTHFE